MSSSISESSGVTSRSVRKCRCGKLARQYCSWKPATVGRRFFGCPDYNVSDMVYCVNMLRKFEFLTVRIMFELVYAYRVKFILHVYCV